MMISTYLLVTGGDIQIAGAILLNVEWLVVRKATKKLALGLCKRILRFLCSLRCKFGHCVVDRVQHLRELSLYFSTLLTLQLGAIPTRLHVSTHLLQRP